MATFWSSKQGVAQLRLSTGVISQNIEANSSYIGSDLDVIVDSGGFIAHASTTTANQIDGITRGYDSGVYRNFSAGTTRIYSSAATVAHNSDGTRGVAFYGALIMPGIFDGSASGVDTLPTIPRATTPNLAGGGGFTTGAAKTINLPRASSGFTHDVSYKIGAKSGTIATGAGVSTSWTPAHDLATEFTTAPSGSVEITVVTKSGATVIGTRKVNFTLTAGAAVVPTVSAVTWDDGNPTVKTNIGGLVQGRSLVKGTVTAAGIHGSTITEKRLKIGAATLAEGQQVMIVEAGPVTASGEATDSRGRVGSLPAGFTVLAWAPPDLHLDEFKVERTNAGGTPTQDGQYLKLTLHSTVSSLIVGSEKNGQTITCRTRPLGGSWTNRNSITTGLEYDNSVLITGGGVFLNTTSYEVEITVTDKTGYQSVITTTVTTAIPTLDLNGTFLGVAKMHERGALDVGGDVYADAFYAGPGPTFIKASLEGHTHTGAEVAAATETARGTVEQATQAEADTGSDDTRYMTPKKVRERAYAPFAMAAGKIAQPAGGGGSSAPIYWGNGFTVTLPAGRFTQPPIVVANTDQAATGGVGAGVDVFNSTTTSVRMRANRVAAAPAGFNLHWIAVQMTDGSAAG